MKHVKSNAAQNLPPHLRQCYSFKRECKRVNCGRLRSKSENCVGQHKEIEIRERETIIPEIFTREKDSSMLIWWERNVKKTERCEDFKLEKYTSRKL